MRPWRIGRRPGPETTPVSSGTRPAVRRPVLGIVSVYLLASLWGLTLPLSSLSLLLGAWAAAVGAALCLNRRAGLPFLYLLIACLGAYQAVKHSDPPSPRSLSALMERPREQMVVRGMIVDDPIEQPGAAGDQRVLRLTVRVTAVNRLGYFQKADGLLSVSWRVPDELPLPSYGEMWQWFGVVRQRDDAGLAWRFLPPFQIYTGADSGERLEESKGAWLKRVSFRGRRAAYDLLERGIEAYPDHVGILRALLLGYRQELPEHLHRIFAWTGSLHVFAISGLHCGVMAGLILAVVKSLNVPRPRWILYLAPLLILYMVGTGLKASAIRATIMALVFGSAFLFNRRPDSPTALAMAALLIVAFAPSQIVAPGFLFSFVVVAGLIRLYPVITRTTSPWFAGEPYAVPAPEDHTVWRTAGRWVGGLLAASIAAWVASIPLTAYYFNLVSPVALIGNLFVIPAAFVVVLTGCLTLLAGSVWGMAAEVFNHANRVVLSALIAVIEWLASWPVSYRYVRSPALGWVLLWYAVLFGGVWVQTRYWRVRGLLLAAGVVAVGLGMHVLDRRTEVQVYDAGDGHAALLRGHDGFVMLFDTGPRYRADRLVGTLRREGIQRIDVLVLSHPLAGHIGGAPTLLDTFPVGEIWTVAHESRSELFRTLQATALAKDIPVHYRVAGNRGDWPGGLAWEVLHPTPDHAYSRAADASLVLRVARNHQALIFTGGAGERVEAEMLTRRTEPRADVLIVGNQGSDGVCGTDWLNEVQPTQIIIASGSRNRRGLPERDVLKRIGAYGITPQRTDKSGTVQFFLKGR